MMTTPARTALLIGLLAATALLAGCPGMPGSPGAEQRMPPGVLPPPGLESGGARTLMGTTVTPPDNFFLLVQQAPPLSEAEQPWRTCRRLIVLENSVLIEGVNYDGRMKDDEKDYNQLVPFSNIESLDWKYEARPTPPAAEEEEATEKPESGSE
jgi:hypothetical protein